EAGRACGKPRRLPRRRPAPSPRPRPRGSPPRRRAPQRGARGRRGPRSGDFLAGRAASAPEKAAAVRRDVDRGPPPPACSPALRDGAATAAPSPRGARVPLGGGRRPA
ncbi:unnamed protein product, partial [Prorocentrum cordatum]